MRRSLVRHAGTGQAARATSAPGSCGRQVANRSDAGPQRATGGSSHLNQQPPVVDSVDRGDNIRAGVESKVYMCVDEPGRTQTSRPKSSTSAWTGGGAPEVSTSIIRPPAISTVLGPRPRSPSNKRPACTASRVCVSSGRMRSSSVRLRKLSTAGEVEIHSCIRPIRHARDTQGMRTRHARHEDATRGA